MNNFSFSRFVTYSKSELVSNRRMLLVLLGSVFAFFMITFYFNHLGQPSSIYHMEDGASEPIITKYYELNTPYILSWVGTLIFCMVFVSTAFKKYFQKGYASASLMLPVAQSEKFAFALIFNNIIVPLVLVGLASAVAYGWAMAYDIEWLFINIPPRAFFDAAMGTCIYMSMFFYGSIFFRRNQFLYTLLSLFAISTVLGYMGYLFMEWMIWWQPDLTWLKDWLKDIFKGWSNDEVISMVRTVGEVVGVLFFMFMWRLSWVRFRKLQITK